MTKHIDIVKAEVADTQEGGKLSVNHDDYSTFILNRIEDNAEGDQVDTDSLASDFKYMISQLQAALKALD